MIETLNSLPANVAGFRATGEITQDDFKNVVFPEVERLVEKQKDLNYLLLLDTDISNFTAGAWFQDVVLGLKNLTNWNRAAIVTDSEGVIKFTDAFSVLAPGEYKGYKKSEFEQAVSWVSGGTPA
jgi:hypothetical protein